MSGTGPELAAASCSVLATQVSAAARTTVVLLVEQEKSPGPASYFVRPRLDS
jgi:hypothetical protein